MYHIPNYIGNRNLLFFILLLVLSSSCARSSKNPAKDSTNNQKIDSLLKKPAGSFSDSITIDFPAAVFYHPDSLQLDKIKAITDSMIFESAMHESFYQMRNSRIVLNKYYPQVKIVEVKNTRFILFKSSGRVIERIDLNTKDDAFGLFIFDGYKPSRFVDMTNIDSELGFYFSK